MATSNPHLWGYEKQISGRFVGNMFICLISSVFCPSQTEAVLNYNLCHWLRRPDGPYWWQYVFGKATELGDSTGSYCWKVGGMSPGNHMLIFWAEEKAHYFADSVGAGSNCMNERPWASLKETIQTEKASDNCEWLFAGWWKTYNHWRWWPTAESNRAALIIRPMGG